MRHLLCVGMGYSARALARRLGTLDWRITGSATSAAGCARVLAQGWEAALFDGTSPSADLALAISNATHLVVSAAPGTDGDPLLRQHAEAIATAPNLAWVGYLSTVGVYGDHQGQWVDEDTTLKPVSQRSRQRVTAETAWSEFAASAKKRLQIFRLAGIYGPGRSAIDNLRDGSARRIIKPNQMFNRIHVDDIANVLDAAIDAPPSKHSIFNVTDDEPAPPQDVVAYAAKLLGLPVPPDIPFEQAPLSPMGLSFYGENKRVSNARLKADLGVTLLYPTYREGMAAIAKAD
jgi:nucleoside-diphosphate-sugar epimerase